MADSVRELIVKNIVEAAQSVTIANGYQENVRQVFRFKLPTLNVREYPTILVIETDEDIQPGRTIGSWEATMRVILQCLVLERGVVSEVANILMADLQKALMLDTTRGGNAIETFLVATDTFVSDEAKPRGGVNLAIDVRYRFAHGDPYTRT